MGRSVMDESLPVLTFGRRHSVAIPCGDRQLPHRIAVNCCGVRSCGFASTYVHVFMDRGWLPRTTTPYPFRYPPWSFYDFSKLTFRLLKTITIP